MDLTPYIDHLREELALAAEAGGDDARALSDRLTSPLQAAARLVLLEALADAADEITRELAPGSVEVRLRGRDPHFVVAPPAGEDAFDRTTAARAGGLAQPDATGGPPPPAAPSSSEVDDGGTSRFNLRLPDSLKLRSEEAARQEGLSLNAWLVRAAAAAVDASGRDVGPAGRSSRGGQHYTGWVR